MNPQNSSKPVMDVSAPRSMQSVAVPQATTEQVAPPVEAPNPEPTPSQVAPKPRQPEVPADRQPKPSAPVGVITVAVLMMMLLSAAAVIVYATSQTA